VKHLQQAGMLHDLAMRVLGGKVAMLVCERLWSFVRTTLTTTSQYELPVSDRAEVDQNEQLHAGRQADEWKKI
jgi:hypothetical protein